MSEEKKCVKSYKLYERYMKECSENPIPRKSEYQSTAGFKVHLLSFFQKHGKNENISVPNWVMSDCEINKVVSFFNSSRDLGFIGISPVILYNSWEFNMLPYLYSTWCTFLFQDEENIIPDFKNFCDLVKVQVHGSREEQADVIFRICFQYSIDKKTRISFSSNFAINSHFDTNTDTSSVLELKQKKSIIDEKPVEILFVIKYFSDLTASFLYGLGRYNNPEYLLWESCGAGLKESNLKVWMKYIFRQTTHHNHFTVSNIKSILDYNPLLVSIIKSSVSMMFGFEFSYNMIPFLFEPKTTLLDVSHAIFLTSLIKNLEAPFVMEIIYSMVSDGINFTNLHKKISHLGPTLLVVQDEYGYVFGAYTTSWKVSPSFRGGKSCFLFRLLPNIVICNASGKNNNFMYLNVTNGGKSIDLGMGGDLNQFGFWLKLSSDQGGFSETCDTWSDFTCLSNNLNFSYIQLEIWKLSFRATPYKVETPVPITRDHYNLKELIGIQEKEPSLLSLKNLSIF